MILIGKIKSGLGEACFWMKKAEEAFYKKIGTRMFYGTLNVELEKDYMLQGNVKVLHKEEYGGTQEVYMKECEILGHKSYIVRTDKNMSENRDHPLNLIEIISDVNFREKYNLKDEDEIEIKIR